MPVPWGSPGRRTRIEGYENRAITVKQLRDFACLVQRLCKCRVLRRTSEFAKQSGKYNQAITWFDVNMYDLSSEVIRRVIPHVDPRCPDDAATGRHWYSWVEFVAQGRPQKPKVFFSHWWGGRFRDFMH